MTDQLLRKTAQAVIPCTSEACEHLIISNELKLFLESHSRFDHPRVMYGGSIGKGTEIVSSDVDIAVFVKSAQVSSYDELLDEFEALLKEWPRNDVMNFRRVVNAIRFTVNNYEFDILPAIDFVHETAIGIEEQLVLQRQRTLDKIQEDPDENYFRYSSSLGFSQVDFVRKQPAAVIDVVRLAKFWYRSVDGVTASIRGGKYIIETIAIKACHREHIHRGSGSFHLDAFREFLELIEKFDSLDIIFEEEYRPLVGHQPPEIREKPSVLDPVNPYNNVARAFVELPAAINALKMHATCTLKNLRKLQAEADAAGVSDFPLWRIIDAFKPNLFCGMDVVKTLATTCDENECKRNKLVEVRASVSSDVQRHIEFMQMCLTVLCKTTAGEYASRVETVYKMKHPDKHLTPATGGKHEDFGATIRIKVDELRSILFSFDIPNFGHVQSEVLQSI